MPVLGNSPNDPIYAEILSGIASEKDPTKKLNRTRAAAERDFWVFSRLVSSFGSYRCGEPSHWLYGKPWIDHPWVFARCRDLQADAEKRRSGVFRNWPRFSFKTELITKLLTLWLTSVDSSLTTALLTWKLNQTGQAMYDGLRTEVETNPKFAALWPKVWGSKDYRSTKEALTVGRPAGPKEPTISIHALDTQPTSMHFDRLVIDDPVVRETVQNPDVMDSTYQAMGEVAALSKDRPWTDWVGTIWRLGDPWMRFISEGRVTRDHHTCYEEDGVTPNLRSEEWIEHQRLAMGPYTFAAQMLGDPISGADAELKVEWLSYYEEPPEECAKGKHVYMVIEPRGSRKARTSDLLAIWIVARGADKKTYGLDLVRERFNLPETGDAVFAMARKWSPRAAFVESYLHAAHFDYLKDRQAREGFRFNLRPLPQIKTPKSLRISHLIPAFSAGRILLPTGGFGHGSKHDSRDTYLQFLQDEYRLWRQDERESAAAHDDCLDGLAWFFQPQVQFYFPFPERIEPELETANLYRRPPRSELAGVSAWAW